MNIGATDFLSNAVAEGYKCHECGASGVKLWRDYQTFADASDLLCVDCACEKQKIATPVEIVRGRGDQLRWMVPAVPTQEGDTYWGYTSVPQPGVEWWWRLPLRSNPAAGRER